MRQLVAKFRKIERGKNKGEQKPLPLYPPGLPASPPFCSPLFAENLSVIEAEKERNIDDVNLQKQPSERIQ